jgi:hypothetical protein
LHFQLVIDDESFAILHTSRDKVLYEIKFEFLADVNNLDFCSSVISVSLTLVNFT